MSLRIVKMKEFEKVCEKYNLIYDFKKDGYIYESLKTNQAYSLFYIGVEKGERDERQRH